MLAIPAPQNQIAKDDGIIVSFVASGKDERERPFTRQRTQVIELLGMLVHLLRVTILKLGPAGGVVSEPLSQRSARGDVLHPLIDLSLRLVDAPRLQSVDQDALAVRTGRRLVSPLQLDVRTGDRVTHRPLHKGLLVLCSVRLPRPRSNKQWRSCGASAEDARATDAASPLDIK